VSSEHQEPRWRDPPPESVGADPGRLRAIRLRDLAARFGFGAATSVAAGITTLVLGPRTGGILLAFPAILAASLTLIADDESAAAAREDARGAVLGAIALAVFAVTGVVLFDHVAPGFVLVVATIVWLAVAIGLYVVLWQRRRKKP
jgi:uncharacterized membrane protein